jgi:hypothetical protein
LAFELTLTRLFSITQWYHFAFLAVSVALLGYGASGTAVSLVPRWSTPPADLRASVLSSLFATAVITAALGLNHLPFDSYRIAWERVQILYLVLYYLALALPFFFAGMVTGLLLAAYPGSASRLYSANLLGAALGAAAPLVFLPWAGEGAVLLVAALGLLGAVAFAFPVARLSWRSILLGACVLLTLGAFFLPSPLRLRLSPYKGISQVLRFPDAETEWQRWNAYARVDRVSSDAIRSAPGLSLSYSGGFPRQVGLFVDGDDLTPILVTPVESQSFFEHLPVALPYQLRPGGSVLVIEPRGGLDLHVALSQGAASVTVVEGNPLVIEAARNVYSDPRVTVVNTEGRIFARRTGELYDVVHLSLHDSYRPVTSGAFSLGERYDLTVEAFEDYLAVLKPDGFLVVERWLQVPPSETVRAGAVAVESLRRQGVEDLQMRLAVIRSWQVGLVLVKNSVLTTSEVTAIRDFGQALGLDLVALPGLADQEANRVNVLEAALYHQAFQQLMSNPEAVVQSHGYDVSPPTDDRPFFFHFFRWAQTPSVIQQLGSTWQPWGGSGYLVLIALLVVSIAISGLLILLPLLVATPLRSMSDRGRFRWGTFFYFGLLGLGFLFAELPLMQRFILFLEEPIYAFTTVVAALMMFSGLGSLLSTRLSARWMLPLLVALLLIYPWALPTVFRALLGSHFLARLAISILCLAPLGLLMGIPFPTGVSWLHTYAPGLVPWAWAINGCSSVLASILSALIALSAGFSWVLAAAALAYAFAWLVLIALHRSARAPNSVP